MAYPTDARDVSTWVVLELSGAGERLAAQGLLERCLEDLFDGMKVFVPYLSFEYDGRSILFNVMEGYSFVQSGLDERVYLKEAQDSPYLRNALHSRGLNLTLSTVTDEVVRNLSDQLSRMFAEDVVVGMSVDIRRGLCKGLAGQVLSVNRELGVAQVLIELRSLKTIRTLPCFALAPREEGS